MRNIISWPRFPLPSTRRMPAFALALLLSAVALASAVSSGVFPGDVEAQTPPAAPTITADRPYGIPTRIRIAWSPATGIQERQYQVRAYQGGWQNWSSWQTMSDGDVLKGRGDPYFYNLTDMQTHLTYQVKMRVKSAGTWSAASNTAGISPQVSNLRVSAADGALHLDWDPVEHPPEENGNLSGKYRYRLVGKDAVYQTLAGAHRRGQTTGISITGLQNGTEYTFHLKPQALGIADNYLQLSSITGTPTSAGAQLQRPVLAVTSGDSNASLWRSSDSRATGWQYRYRQAPAKYGSWTTVPAADAAKTKHAVTGLTQDTEYRFQVRALRTEEGGATAHGPASREMKVFVELNRPPAFTSPAAFSVDENQTAVGAVAASDADASDSVTRYTLLHGSRSHASRDASYFQIDATTGVLSFKAAPDFENPGDYLRTAHPQSGAGDNRYILRVQADSGSGSRAKRGYQWITVNVGNTADAADGKPAIQGSPQVGQRLTVDLSNVNDQDGMPESPAYSYRWYVTNSQQQRFFTTITTPHYNLGTADLGYRVSVRVDFTDAAENDEQVFSDATTPVSIPPVTGLSASHVGCKPHLTWDSLSYATSYRYQYRPRSEDWSETIEVPVAGTSVTLANLDHRKQHLFRVYALYYDRMSAAPLLPAIWWPNDQSTEAPGAVTNIQLTHAGDHLDVTWDAPEGACDYDVTYTQVGGNTGRGAWEHPNTTLEIRCDVRDGYENQNCVSGSHAYRVGIRARNASGAGPWANSPNVNPPPPPPPPPADDNPPNPVTGITVTHNGDNLSVSWDASDGATGYDVTYTNAADNSTGRGAWDHAGTTLTITCDVRDGHENQNCVNGDDPFRVGIRAKNAHGESHWRNSENVSP